MRIPRRRPIYPWEDNDPIYFGTDYDWDMKFDGTSLAISKGSDLAFQFRLSGDDSYFYGQDTSGDDLHIHTNSADAYPKISMYGNSFVRIYHPAGQSITLYDAATAYLKTTYSSNFTTIAGGAVSGDKLGIKCNSVDAYPYIAFRGNDDTDLYLYAGSNFDIHEGETQFFRVNRSGSSFVTDLTTGAAYKTSWSTSTSTANIIGHEIDVSTNLTMGTNFGVTGLKITTIAANGSGESYGIDVSGVPDTEITLKYTKTGDTVTADPQTDAANHWIKGDEGGTAYYIPCYTVDGA